MTAVAATSSPGRWSDCRLCASRLDASRRVGERRDDVVIGLCAECQTRPEAARFGKPLRAVPPGPAPFTAAERALIKATHSYMPTAQLLGILNDRLAGDGRGAAPHTLEQLHAELRGLLQPGAVQDWAGLRQLLGQARRAGVLAAVTGQIVDDFAVVFQLSPAQHTALRDVIRAAQEDR